jgi:hypothetical protein
MVLFSGVRCSLGIQSPYTKGQDSPAINAQMQARDTFMVPPEDRFPRKNDTRQARPGGDHCGTGVPDLPYEFSLWEYPRM